MTFANTPRQLQGSRGRTASCSASSDSVTVLHLDFVTSVTVLHVDYVADSDYVTVLHSCDCLKCKAIFRQGQDRLMFSQLGFCGCLTCGSCDFCDCLAYGFCDLCDGLTCRFCDFCDCLTSGLCDCLGFCDCLTWLWLFCM